jgi:hypothetical protein
VRGASRKEIMEKYVLEAKKREIIGKQAVKKNTWHWSVICSGK